MAIREVITQNPRTNDRKNIFTNTFYINKDLLMKKVENTDSSCQMLKQVLLELANIPKDKVEFTIKFLHRINKNSY